MSDQDASYKPEEVRAVLAKALTARNARDQKVLEDFTGRFFKGKTRNDILYTKPRWLDIFDAWQKETGYVPPVVPVAKANREKPTKQDVVDAALTPGHRTHAAGIIGAASIAGDTAEANAQIGEFLAGNATQTVASWKRNAGCAVVATAGGLVALTGWMATQGLRTGADKAGKLQNAVEVREKEIRKAQGLPVDDEQAKPAQPIQPQGVGR